MVSSLSKLGSIEEMRKRSIPSTVSKAWISSKKVCSCFLLPNTKDELIDYAICTGAPMEVVENLQEIEDEGDMYESIDEIWPDYPSEEDYLWNEDEY